jgi:hypothetical protein
MARPPMHLNHMPAAIVRPVKTAARPATAQADQAGMHRDFVLFPSKALVIAHQVE